MKNTLSFHIWFSWSQDPKTWLTSTVIKFQWILISFIHTALVLKIPANYRFWDCRLMGHQMKTLLLLWLTTFLIIHGQLPAMLTCCNSPGSRSRAFHISIVAAILLPPVLVSAKPSRPPHLPPPPPKHRDPPHPFFPPGFQPPPPPSPSVY